MAPLLLSDIEALIPHRGDSLLLTEITGYTAEKTLTATYALKASHPMLKGHFPSNPIWPGVMSLEGLAQAAATLTSLSKNVSSENVLYLFVGTEEVRFLAPIIPPEVLTYEVTQLFERRGLFKFEGKVSVEGKEVMKATFLAKMIVKEES